jgi:hypothetical protein
MSCFIVSDEHLSAILQFCKAHAGPLLTQFPAGLRQHEELTAIGRQLQQVNAAAFRGRYSGRHAESLPTEDYTYAEPKTPPVSPIAFIKLVNCLEYQCCDWADWDTSQYRHLTQGWKDKALHALPGYTRGYADAAWSI